MISNPRKPIGTLPDNPFEKDNREHIHEEAEKYRNKQKEIEAQEQKAKAKQLDDDFDKLLKETGQNA